MSQQQILEGTLEHCEPPMTLTGLSDLTISPVKSVLDEASLLVNVCIL